MKNKFVNYLLVAVTVVVTILVVGRFNYQRIVSLGNITENGVTVGCIYTPVYACVNNMTYVNEKNETVATGTELYINVYSFVW